MNRYKLCEEGCWYDVVEAPSLEAALKIAVGNARGSNYGEPAETIWIDVRAQSKDNADDEDTATVALHPREPGCTDHRDHDWRSPICIVGGNRENPGVIGHGGGVKIHEVCRHCGTHMHTNTWAQRPDTGEQGLRSIRYEPADDESLAWVASQPDNAAVRS